MFGPCSTIEKCVSSHGLGCHFQKGRLPLIFIDINRRVKYNGEYYKTEILEKHLLPAARTFFEFFKKYECFYICKKLKKSKQIV
jgi:hypothetical protein